MSISVVYLNNISISVSRLIYTDNNNTLYMILSVTVFPFFKSNLLKEQKFRI